jgi:lambda repressor-like predicted transcriptional regulator
MSIVTKNISRYINKKGFNLKKLSRETGIPYNSLYSSLCNPTRNRDLRDDEFVKICSFIGVNPMDFANNPSAQERDKI